MKSDFYLAGQLAAESNCYREFFETFAGSHYLTFNYDALPETILFRLGHWYPDDGYGVPVSIRRVSYSLGFQKAAVPSMTSRSLVLHLHGAFCVCTSESTIRRELGNPVSQISLRDQPLYFFDPDSITSNFPGFLRAFDYHVPICDRVIAPVPDKADGLREAFVSQARARAIRLVRDSGSLVAIGYSFNRPDRASYHALLQALGESRGRKLLLVSPDACKLAERLRIEYTLLDVDAIGETFKGWAATSFSGLPSACD